MPSNPFDGPPGMIPQPDAGKNYFSELLCARKFLRKVTLRTHEKDWYVYDGRAWTLKKRAHFEALAYNLLPEMHREVKNARAVLDAAQMQQQLSLDQNFVGAIRFHTNAVLINCDNGLLRVEPDGVRLMKHDQEQLFTGVIPAAWPVDGKSPELFRAVLDEVLPDKGDQDLLKWFAGYLLFPSCKHEVFMISHGGGGSGKSTVSEAIMEVIGNEPQRTVLSMAQICAEGQGAYSLPSLRFALVNMGTELDTVSIGDSSNFKRLVSGEGIEVRPIYGTPYVMRGYSCKMWFNANSLPRFKHGTDAELRRARFLEFVHPPKVQDVTMKERLARERDYILQWMVEGLQGVLRGERCPMGGAESQRVRGKFAISNDPVSAFAKECLDFGPALECRKDDLWEAFSDFLGSWGFPAKNREQLFRTFYERFPEVEAFRVSEDSKHYKAGQYIAGVKVKEPPEVQPAYDEEEAG